MKLVNPVYVRERPEKAVLTAEGCFEARASLFKCQERARKQFSPLWRSCEARASLFMCGNDLRKPF